MNFDHLGQLGQTPSDCADLALLEFQTDKCLNRDTDLGRLRFGRNPVRSPLDSMRFIRDWTVLRATPNELANSATLILESLLSSPSNWTSSLSMLSTL